MRKLVSFIIILLFLCLTSLSYAAGSVTQQLSSYDSGRLKILTFSWTADSSNAKVPGAVTSVSTTNALQGYYIYMVVTKPGSPAPTSNYDIILNDQDGMDMMGGTLANRSATAVENAVPKVDTTNTLYGGRFVNGNITLLVDGNLVNSAKGTVKIFLSK